MRLDRARKVRRLARMIESRRETEDTDIFDTDDATVTLIAHLLASGRSTARPSADHPGDDR